MKKKDARQCIWRLLGGLLFRGGCLAALLVMVTFAWGQVEIVNTGNEQNDTLEVPVDSSDVILLSVPVKTNIGLPELVLQALGLTTEQETELRHLRVDIAEDLQWLNDQSKRQALTTQGAVQRYRELIKKYRTLRDSLLTDAQVDLLDRTQEYLVRLPRKPILGPQVPLVELLALNKYQQAQGHALLANYRNKLLALQDSDAVLDTVDTIYGMEEMRLAFEAMLTPFQSNALARVRLVWQQHRQEQTALDSLMETVVEQDTTWRDDILFETELIPDIDKQSSPDSLEVETLGE